MSCSSCGSRSPLVDFLKSQSPDALWQARLKPKDPFDPKELLGAQNPPDTAAGSNASVAGRAANAPGTGLRVDFTA